jgi:UDP-N-acetylglucosamine diphosphorylase/glucosamine-1-phosphate N-acetyltransferase
MNIILFDNNREDFYPLSLTRPISYFRLGILTIIEKWNLHFQSVSVLTDDYLTKKFSARILDDNIWINSQVIPSDEILTEIKNLRIGECLKKDSILLAFRNSEFVSTDLNIVQSNSNFIYLSCLTDIFSLNGDEILSDIKILQLKSNNSLTIDKSNHLIGNDVFIEEGAKINCSVLDSSDGPIYIGKDVEIMPGCLIKGPFAICNNSVLKMGAKVYGPTTIGPYCKVGGEINNSVFFGYSSKAHDGFLGNSVVGEWCNFGADSNNSNLKNNYDNVKLWSYKLESFKHTDLQFCGLIMGDHSKCGINTMFNTGTIIGVGSNIFGSGFPRNFIPSFSWGGSSGFTIHKLEKFFHTAEIVMKRRGCDLEDDREILSKVYDMTKRYRNEH